ncbi:DNA-binding PadR family transcriptional regulator [Alkalihalobacillus xiaoxiensis]|uniref:DNA-binding PadR family transcriptional regulator n=1 Tax=Shouchella xiaoxiensis TaxID=766895 RepID=A0ABS2STT5_9BACI|nr:PadR family transcriptional regulator [Shouchella xiaoxiensis]MBM7838958.1 DNA-binding PadR family transcriptional regulator [Shouchella xiaoxiensis]
MDKEMMKGSIDFLLLSLIGAQDLYGYEMTKKLKALSEENYSMSEGTLYPALKRMEKKDWISSYWNDTTGARRKYYTITDSGKTELERKKKDWSTLNKLIQRTGDAYEL